MRVGDSFIADVNRFAAAVTYATDNDVLVVQSALGTLNNSSLARDAVDYAYGHGVTTIVSAADEAAQHNNQPYLPHTILVNSVTRRADRRRRRPTDQSYLAFNGCTNFNAKITLAIPSTSCSSDAVGVGSGLAGLIYQRRAQRRTSRARSTRTPTCVRAIDGRRGTALDPCVITPERGPPADGLGRRSRGQAMPDDVNFASPLGAPEPSCTPVPSPAARTPTGPARPGGAVQTLVDANRPSAAGSDRRAAQLPGPRRPRPVLRLRPGQHQPQRPGAARRPEPAPAPTRRGSRPRPRSSRRSGTSRSTRTRRTSTVTGRGLRARRHYTCEVSSPRASTRTTR